VNRGSDLTNRSREERTKNIGPLKSHFLWAEQMGETVVLSEPI
jgi:hypothetical protein